MAGGLLVYLLSMALIILGVLSAYVRVWRDKGAVYSLADCFVAIQNVWEFGMLILPITVIFLFQFLRKEDKASFIIREDSRKMYWNKQAYKGILFSLMMTLYVQSCTFVIGGLASNSYINWGQIGSLYYQSTGKHTNAISFPMFLLIASVMVFLKFLNISLLTILSGWTMKRKEFFIVIVILISGAEDFLRDIQLHIFTAMISISYDRWVPTQRLIGGAGYGLLLMVILWYAGVKYVKRKDFLNEEG